MAWDQCGSGARFVSTDDVAGWRCGALPRWNFASWYSVVGSWVRVANEASVHVVLLRNPL